MPFAARFLLLAPLCAVLAGCGTDDISNARQERFFARTDNEVGRVKSSVERYNWAKGKNEEYALLVDEAEAELRTLREELIELRRGNDKRAQELAGLRAEAQKLDGEIAAAGKAVEEKKKAVAGAQAELKKVEEERAALRGRLAKLKTDLPFTRRQIESIERRLSGN